MRTDRRVRRWVGRGLVVALVVLVAAPGAATAVSTETILTETTRFDEPSLALDRDDRAHLAYIGSGAEPGLYYATNGAGEWVSTRITTETDDAPAIAIDRDGRNHIAFVRHGAGTGVYHATDESGDWVITRLAEDAAESPSIALDPAGGVHIAFASKSFDPGIVVLEDTSGRWVRTQVTAAHLDGATAIVAQPGGGSTVAFARYAPEAPGIYVASTPAPSGPWTVDRLTEAYDDDPSMVLGSGGAIDVAFVRFQATGRGLYHASGPGPWSVQAVVVADDRSFERPSIAAGPGGRPTIAYSVAGASGELRGLFGASQRADGSWMTGEAITNAGRADDWPSVAVDSRGETHVAFAELDLGPHPGVYVRGPDAFSVVAGSTIDSDVSMASVGDEHLVAFKRTSPSDDGGVLVGRDTTGRWRFETAASDPSAPSVVVDASRHATIYAGDRELSNATGAWVRSTLGLDGYDVRATLDDEGHRWLAFQRAADTPMIASNAFGGWRTASGFFDFSGTGAVAVGPGGRIHWVVAGDTLAYQSATALDGPWSERILGEHAADPGIKVDEDGRVHIVWRRTSSDEGTYYTTNKTGTWVTTRLTRTSAEGGASLALDATGRVFVAVTRTHRAASPGLYLVTNRTGRWATTRLDGSYDATDPQLSLDASGHATIVLGRRDGLRAFEVSDFTRPTASDGSMRHHEVDVGSLRGGDPGGASPPSVQTDPSGPATVPHDHETGTDP